MMRITFETVLVVGFTLLSTRAASACTTPGAQGNQWQDCLALTVYIDPTVGSMNPGPGTTPTQQVQNAITIWANEISDLAIKIPLSATPLPADANATILAASIPGSPNAGAVTAYTSTSATTTINTTSNSIDPYQSAYATFITKLILHEYGHIFGMADVYQPAPCNQYADQSVMDQICNVGSSLDDYGQGIPLQPTTCDATRVISNYLAAPGCSVGGCDCASGYKCCSGTCITNGSTCTTPIVLDAFDQGYHLTSLTNGVQFRLLPGGPLQQVSWTDASWKNGWLALDRNGNGTIDDFTELFGNLTPQPSSPDPNGFLALAVFDEPANGGNGNGFIDPGDAVYPHLRVWIDANHNGVSEPSELHTLQELGIFKIGLEYQLTPFVDQYGNRFRFKASFWDERGNEKDLCYDVILLNQSN